MQDHDEIAALTILPLSVAKDLPTALTEWEFTGEIIEYSKDDLRTCELCGHVLKYHYVIKNRKNAAILKVGSECVYTFPYIRVDVEKLRKGMQRKKIFDLKKFVNFDVMNIRGRMNDLIRSCKWNLQYEDPYWSPAGMSVREANNLLFRIEIERTGEKLRENLDTVIRIGGVLGYQLKHEKEIREYLEYIKDKKTLMR